MINPQGAVVGARVWAWGWREGTKDYGTIAREDKGKFGAYVTPNVTRVYVKWDDGGEDWESVHDLELLPDLLVS